MAMGETVCHVLLHYSAARLWWKTAKCLRRSQSCHGSTSKACTSHNSNSLNPSPTTATGGNENDNVSLVEWSILQGWTILALHYLYVAAGAEYVAKILPFYFHVKACVLVATFVVPSWSLSGRDGSGEFGLSPAISYWFDYLIVPGVHKVHELVDHDPKGWAKRQIAIMPLLLIDYFIIPGILTFDEGLFLETKERRPPHQNFDEDEGMQLVRKLQSLEHEDGNDKSPLSPSDDIISSRHISADGSRTGDNPCQEPIGIGIASENANKGRGSKTSTLSQEPPQPIISPLLRKNKLSSSISHIKFGSPVLLKKFHNNGRNRAELIPKALSLHGKRDFQLMGDDVTRGVTAVKNGNSTRVVSSKPHRKRRERLSVGDHFREIVTGDANVRVRDHLFDLDLPPSPLRHSPTQAGLQEHESSKRTAKNRSGHEISHAPTIGARRSFRLAKKKQIM